MVGPPFLAESPTIARTTLNRTQLRVASRSLERLAGRVDVEDILDEVFAGLCVGK